MDGVSSAVSSTGNSRVRACAALAAATLLALLGPDVASARPDAPKPTIASVNEQLDRLATQAEALTEQYNATRVEIARVQHAIAMARRKQQIAQAQYQVTHARFVTLAVAQYEDGDLDSFGALLTSDDPATALANMADRQLVAHHSADLLQQVEQARVRAEGARNAAEQLLRQAQQKRRELGDKRRAVVERTTKYQSLLSELTLAQQTAYVNWGAPTRAEIRVALNTPAPSAAAGRAVQFAVEQIGKPYVWGASGPDAYDCSGLTMSAWAHAGVALPHYSAAQYDYGRHVGYDQLKPGDLIFLYGDLHHVEMYVGAGIAISAPQEGEPVKYVRVADYRSDFYGATRLG
jgi:cell wall-associated NlpC family hydrolase